MLLITLTQNMDLTYQVLFNLAVQEETNELYAEALNHYQIIVKNKLFQQVGKIRVNMGNIYFKTKEYNKAVKVLFWLIRSDLTFETSNIEWPWIKYRITFKLCEYE